MPLKTASRLTLSNSILTSPQLSTEVCNLLLEIAQKTSLRLNDNHYGAALYLEFVYLYMHILSRLLFYEFGGPPRDVFIRQCFEQLTEHLSAQIDRHLLLSELQNREQFYCRFPCLEEHSTDIGFIAHGFKSLLLEKEFPLLLVERATLLINDGCILLLRRLASYHIRLHPTAY